MKKTLTVFTPTFNRAYSLPRGYEALKRQTCKDFKWLIIDDGSTDNTQELVKEWMAEGKIEIEYCYKENGGMHTAHNKAYELIDTELNVCIDSDDCMTDDAVEKIVDFWRKNGNDCYAGIIALNETTDGKIIGTALPSTLKAITLTDFYRNGGKGDKKLIYRTDVITRYPPYPVFEGEKYVGLGYKYSLVDKDYPLLILNEVVCMVDYREDGSTLNMYKQYWNNPKGFAFLRKHDMEVVSKSFSAKFKSCIHYVSSSIISKNKHFIGESPLKGMTILSIPAGCLLYLWIRHKVKKNTNFLK